MSRVGMPFSEFPGDSIFKAFSIAGSSFSNSTSTTAPMTCDTLPSFIMSSYLTQVIGHGLWVMGKKINVLHSRGGGNPESLFSFAYNL
jgi:hypothetical protein